jgi:para-aminobenzoate synthetase component 1
LSLINKLNHFGKNNTPFFFVISYDLKSYDVISLENMPKNILFKINDKNITNKKSNLLIEKPIFSNYKNKFEDILLNIKNGNTYIANLTCKTLINQELNLKGIYDKSNSKYNLYYKNKFISFSPEPFIKISNNIISSYPMKGTIDAKINNAKNILLNNKKELAEHTMIVDLIRNDLSIVASDVKVDKFRYCEKIYAGTKELYQTSSKISARLDNNWNENIGDIITSLLPAGSITGTPKKSTINILNNIEDYNRDYYTGIWGIYDGKTLDSSVLIRFIENNNGKYYYKSGGGITIDSVCIDEYNEMIDKIYLP